jgi:hypothetical protein
MASQEEKRGKKRVESYLKTCNLSWTDSGISSWLRESLASRANQFATVFGFNAKFGSDI